MYIETYKVCYITHFHYTTVYVVHLTNITWQIRMLYKLVDIKFGKLSNIECRLLDNSYHNTCDYNWHWYTLNLSIKAKNA